MFKKIAKSQYFCGVDLGSHSIKVAFVRLQDENNLELLGVFELPCQGFKDSSITDLTDFASSITQAIEGVSQRVAVKPTAVYAGISSDAVTVRRSAALIPLMDAGTKIVAPSDVKKVIHQARLLGAGIDEEIIHSIELFYKIDDVNVALNPVGLYGRKIESNLLMMIANTGRLRNINKAVHQAGFDVHKISMSSFAASQVALDDEFRKQGCAFIDIGAHMTTVLFYKNGILGDVQIIRWGGANITSSIAERLSLTLDLAEEIKKTHAVASKLNPQEASGDILVKRDKGYVPIRRQSVCEAVEWEIENLLTHLETVLKGSGLFHQLYKGVVMVGGTALLPGLMERIEQRVNLTVSLGVATKGLQNPSIFAGAIGLAQMNYFQKKHSLVNVQATGHWAKMMVGRMKEMCQEYF